VAEAIYALCFLTSLACAVLLFRGYRGGRGRLLLWSSGCFLCLALNNALLFVDLVLVPSIDLSVPRALVGLVAVTFLLAGFIWDGG
jgi:hypothetical protein